jgi:large subunit ribosomal protein L21
MTLAYYNVFKVLELIMSTTKYVIFKRGSRQYRVQEGDVIDIDLIEAEKGAQVTFEEILFVGDEKNLHVGNPSVKDYKIQCEVLGEIAGPKITSIKYKPSHNQVRKFGHRQHYTRLKVVGISKKKEK